MTSSISTFISTIQSEINDETFNIVLNTDWRSEVENHRLKIREHLATVDSSYFNQFQLVQLYDLNQRPQAAEGFISISHCTRAGGYSYSKYPHGFDIEDIKRISDPIIIRTSSEEERLHAPHLKFLWTAKEAAYKALSHSVASSTSLLITDLNCQGWKQNSQLQLWTYQVTSPKLIDVDKNQGYIFSTPTLLIGVYFK